MVLYKTEQWAYYESITGLHPGVLRLNLVNAMHTKTDVYSGFSKEAQHVYQTYNC